MILETRKDTKENYTTSKLVLIIQIFIAKSYKISFLIFSENN